ncbi:MAG TPA: cupin domain-containing protein [Bryobacteraceae bacterium]|nr:cupin domain-containing protein [Bryobacteraceae bacterium]
MILTHIAARAEFGESKMGKVQLASGAYLYAGLNCFLPGQEHAAHVHANQDKLYVVLEGSGEATVGDEQHSVAAGDLVFAPAGVPHGMKNTGESNLVVLVTFSPPPTI